MAEELEVESSTPDAKKLMEELIELKQGPPDFMKIVKWLEKAYKGGEELPVEDILLFLNNLDLLPLQVGGVFTPQGLIFVAFAEIEEKKGLCLPEFMEVLEKWRRDQKEARERGFERTRMGNETTDLITRKVSLEQEFANKLRKINPANLREIMSWFKEIHEKGVRVTNEDGILAYFEENGFATPGEVGIFSQEWIIFRGYRDLVNLGFVSGEVVGDIDRFMPGTPENLIGVVAEQIREATMPEGLEEILRKVRDISEINQIMEAGLSLGKLFEDDESLIQEDKITLLELLHFLSGDCSECSQKEKLVMTKNLNKLRKKGLKEDVYNWCLQKIEPPQLKCD